MDKEKILNKVKVWSTASKKYFNGTEGNVTGAVYTNDEKHWNFIADIMRESIVSNPLHSDEFKYVT